MTHPTTHQLEQHLAKVLALVENDNHAATFQSLAQYRASIAAFIKEIAK